MSYEFVIEGKVRQNLTSQYNFSVSITCVCERERQCLGKGCWLLTQVSERKEGFDFSSSHTLLKFIKGPFVQGY